MLNFLVVSDALLELEPTSIPIGIILMEFKNSFFTMKYNNKENSNASVLKKHV